MISKLISSAGFLSSGGTIGGDLTISGDLTVQGGGSLTYDEIVEGTLAVSPVQYSTGTASQSGTTVTGSGTTWTDAMIGSKFVYADGTSSGLITARASNTSITVTTSQTVSSQSYNIHYIGLQITSAGLVGIGNIAPESIFHIYSADPVLIVQDSDTSYNGNASIQLGTSDSSADFEHGTRLRHEALKFYIQETSDNSSFTNLMILDTNSRISLSNNDSGTENTVFGNLAWDAGSAAGADYNSLFGYGAGRYLADDGASNHSSYNTAFGNKAIGGGHTSTATGNTANKNVGIGFHAVGGGLGGTTNLEASGNVGVGYDALQAISTGTNNVAIGQGASDSLTTDSNVVAIGYGAYNSMDTATDAEGSSGHGSGNIAIGYNSMSAYTNVGAIRNTAIGFETMMTGADHAAIDNVALGFQALKGLTSGDSNVAIGSEALDALTTGSDNIAIGKGALSAVLTVGDNLAIGRDAMLLHTTGNQNTAVGHYTLDSSASDMVRNTALGYNTLATLNHANADNNTALGAFSGLSLTQGQSNVFVGDGSGYLGTTVSYAVCVGAGAGRGAMDTNANFSIFIGRDAGYSVTTGAGNLAIGGYAMQKHTTGSRNMAIGYGAMDDTDDTFTDSVRDSDITGTGTTVIMDGANTDLSAGMGVTAATGVIPVGTKIASVTSTSDPATFELDTSMTATLAADTVLTFSGCLAADDNMFIGYDAGGGTWVAEGVAEYNVGVGNYVMDAAMNGAVRNTGVGFQALTSLTTGKDNVTMGFHSGYALTTGLENVIIGNYAGDAITAENECVLIGYGAGSALNDDAADGTVAIGYLAGYNITTATFNTVIGYQAAMAQTTGGGNTVIGYQAFKAAEDGEAGNVIIGANAGDLITGDTSDDNVIIGNEAGRGGSGGLNRAIIIGRDAMKATSSNSSVGQIAIGTAALGSVTSGLYNTALGYFAGTKLAHADADSNVFVGYGAGAGGDDTTGNNSANNNVGIGYLALGATTDFTDDGNAFTGTHNVAIGQGAQQFQETGTYNIAIGAAALDASTDGDYNIAIGFNALGNFNASGDSNVAIGNGAGDAFGTNSVQNTVLIGTNAGGAINSNGANFTVAIGSGALSYLQNGGDNIAVGYLAGDTLTTGADNTIIGDEADVSASGSANQSVLGQGATGVADNSVTLGNASVTDVYMAQDSGAIVHSGALVNGLSAILLTTGTLAYATHSIVRGKYVTVSADAQTLTLPAVVVGAVFIIVNIAADGAALLTIDPDGNDKFLLDIAGAAGTDGNNISNTKATQNQGDFVKLVGMSADGWAITEIGGIWADE